MTRTFLDSAKKTLLTEAEMETIERDLRLRPALAETAQTLTPKQIGSFNRDGYLLPLS